MDLVLLKSGSQTEMIITLYNPFVVSVVLIRKCGNYLTAKMSKEPEIKQHNKTYTSHSKKTFLQKHISEGKLSMQSLL